MSRFDEWKPKPKEDDFRFEDRMQIEKLLKGKKLTDKQREALRRLLASYDYALD
jgi:hypothetical protein